MMNTMAYIQTRSQGLSSSRLSLSFQGAEGRGNLGTRMVCIISIHSLQERSRLVATKITFGNFGHIRQRCPLWCERTTFIDEKLYMKFHCKTGKNPNCIRQCQPRLSEESPTNTHQGVVRDFGPLIDSGHQRWLPSC